jgi:hypothetical protein
VTTLPVSHLPSIHTRIHPRFQGRHHDDLHMHILHPLICLHHNGVQSPQHQFPIQTRSAPPVSLRVTSHSLSFYSCALHHHIHHYFQTFKTRGPQLQPKYVKNRVTVHSM